MLEYVGESSIDSIPEGKTGIEWFRNWCFGTKNLNNKLTRQIVPQLRAYNVHICRPSYPRYINDTDGDFQLIDLLANVVAARTIESTGDDIFEVRRHQYRDGLARLRKANEGSDARAWLAKLMYPGRLGNAGQVFLSIPSHCELHADTINKAI